MNEGNFQEKSLLVAKVAKICCADQFRTNPSLKEEDLPKYYSIIPATTNKIPATTNEIDQAT